MEAKAQALAQVAMKLGQAIYESQQAETQAAAGADAGTSGQSAHPDQTQEEVVDAEFSEVDDEKKG